METVELMTLQASVKHAEHELQWLQTQVAFCRTWAKPENDNSIYLVNYLASMYESISAAIKALDHGVDGMPWRIDYDKAITQYEMDKHGFLLIAESVL